MGPGSRQDTLDDIFGFHNFKVVDAMDEVLPDRLVTAVQELVGQEESFQQFDQGLESHVSRSTMDGWVKEVEDWERDHDKPCPYEAQLEAQVTRKGVELEMARQEHKELVKGTRVYSSSICAFIVMGIQIEDEQ
jgi:hypothetical protein